MSDSRNLMGLNLSVDNDLIADAAKEAIIASITSAMSYKEQLVHEFVKACLTERVLVEDGTKPRGYSSEKTCSRMEWYVRKEIMEAVRVEVANMIEEQKPAIRELVRKEFKNTKTQSKFVDMFIDSLTESITSKYSTSISVEFTSSKDY